MKPELDMDLVNGIRFINVVRHPSIRIPKCRPNLEYIWYLGRRLRVNFLCKFRVKQVLTGNISDELCDGRALTKRVERGPIPEP